jgi:hypothetical protein
MRTPYTTGEALRRGITESELRWAVRKGTVQRIARGVYVDGYDFPTPIERAMAKVVLHGAAAGGTLAGVLHELDGVTLRPPYVVRPRWAKSDRKDVVRRTLFRDPFTEIQGISCLSGFETIIELAQWLDDNRWEQALESALRKKLFELSRLQFELEDLGRSRVKGTRRIRRVLGMRPEGAPPTGSILETLMVQLIREHTDLPDPRRQVEVLSEHGTFIAFVDFAWPDVGMFLELDGQQHKGQPVYDARRETAVVASKGWLPGRFTWHEVTRIPVPTAQRVVAIYNQARLIH